MKNTSISIISSKSKKDFILGSNGFLNTVLQILERQFLAMQAMDRKQTAKAIGIGLSTLDLRIKDGRNLPRYIKIGDAKNSRIVFPLLSIAEFLTNQRQKVL